MTLTPILDAAFTSNYTDRRAPFGWNGLGEFVFRRTYSRPTERGPESWAQVCERVITGMYAIQRDYAPTWSEDKAQRSAREAYDLLFNLRWSPPGRGLWMMGTDFVHERQQPEALQNCAFISSDFIAEERGDFFRWVMEMLMLGVGVGFDTRGAGKLELRQPAESSVTYIVPDSRQGWAESLEALVDSYIEGGPTVRFDYNWIRPYGEAIKGFGGVASGPAPLRMLHEQVRAVLGARLMTDAKLSARDIVDLCNMIGQCVIAGNVRRSAEIAIGDASSEFLDLKDYSKNPERAAYGWTSNNSILAERGMDYTDAAERTWANGEPGYLWMENAQQFGRMNGRSMGGDEDVLGFNPCAEQQLGHREMCTLVEIYLPRIASKAEFARTIKFAYLYGKSVTLFSEQISDELSRRVMTTKRRIGLSLTGQAQFLTAHGYGTLIDWMDFGYQLSGYYDSLYSIEWLGVPESVRRTSVKPSGTVSLLAGVTPGVHFPISRFYTRRVTVAADSSLVGAAEAAGHVVEQDVVNPGSVKIEFPVDVGEGIRGESDVSLEDQVELAVVAQRHWADNAVSFTGKFDKTSTTPGDIARVLERAEGTLKAISLLPLVTDEYQQMPYEEITAEQYALATERLNGGMSFGELPASDYALDKYCEGEACEM